ncbi:MAG TPA: hypothetical protein VNA24_02565 [Hyalangium sp.]|nr:hypothetical protein [Hyalangium sp.]
MTSLLALLLAATPVQVVADPCVGVSAAEVQRIATVELSGSRGPTAPVQAHLSCRDSAVEVRVDDAITRKSLLRSIDLTPLAESTRARYVALAIAELVAASWSELLLPEPRVVPTGPPPSKAERAAAVQALPTSRFTLLVAATGRTFRKPGLWLVGASLRVQSTTPGQLGLAVELAGAHGSARVEAGTVNVDILDGAAFVTWSPLQSFLAATVGAGVRAGGARLLGVPSDTASFTGGAIAGALAGPCAMGQLSLGGPSVGASLGLEVGTPVWRLRGEANGVTVMHLEGMWLSASLGAVFEM